MNTWLEPKRVDAVSNMKSQLIPDETTTSSGHEAIPQYADQTPSRIRLVPSQGQQQEISAVSSVHGTDLDPDDTVPNMKIVRKPKASLTPGSVSPMPHADANLVPSRIGLASSQGQQQEISAVSSVRGTDLDLDDTVPTMKIMHKPEASLTPGSVSPMPHADANLVPPQNRRQPSPLIKHLLLPQRNQALLNPASLSHFNDTPIPGRNQALLNPVSLSHFNDITIPGAPTQPLPAVGVPALKGEAKKSQKKSLLGIVVRAVVTVLLFAFLLRSMNWTTLVPTLMHVSHTYLLIGLSAGFLCVLFSSYGWRSVVLAENIRVDLAHLINLYLVGISFSHFLPTSMGGDALKVYYVGRDSGNMPGAASAVLMSRITSFVGMLLIALPALAILHAHFTDQVVTWFLLLSLLLLVAIVGSVLTALVLPSLSSRFLKGRWAKNTVVMKFLEIGEALSSAVKRPRSMFSATIFGMLFWGASFLNYYGYALALRLHVPLTFYVIAIPFVSIIAALPISINGFGVRESAFVYLFTTIHVPPTTSLALALLMDAQVLLFGLIGGWIYFTMSRKKR